MTKTTPEDVRQQIDHVKESNFGGQMPKHKTEFSLRPLGSRGETVGTHIWFDFDECNVHFMVHILDCGVVARTTFQLYFYSLLVDEYVSVGDDPAVLCHYKARATRHGELLTGKWQSGKGKGKRASSFL